MTDIPTNILVIEDEPQMQKFLRMSLASEGYRVVEAAKGQEGIDLARTHNPDLVLLDLGLPDMDGTEVTRALREWTARPIIVISARGLGPPRSPICKLRHAASAWRHLASSSHQAK